MAAVAKHWRESATLILVTSSKLTKGINFNLISATLADSPSSLSSCDNFDVLLLKRSSKSAFMPNMHVFPGGVAVNSDFSPEWLSIFGKLGSITQSKLFKQLSEGSSTAAPMFTRQRDPVYSVIPPEVAFRICSIRETFEESGVLLALPVEQSKNILASLSEKEHVSTLSPTPLYDSKVINTWRKRVTDDPSEFLNMCLELGLIPEVWALYEWSNWLTPARKVEGWRRFDTVFFVCCVDYKPAVMQDDMEVVNALWASPSSFITAYYEQKGGLAQPQFYELSRLLNFQSAYELLKFLSHPERTRVQRWLVNIFFCKGYYIETFPGDDLYVSSEILDIIELNESLDELNQKYHNRNRMWLDEQMLIQVDCTLPSEKGHVYPAMDVLNNIKKRMKAKL